MKVGDVMTRFVDFVAGDAIVCEAAALMGEIDVGALPVGDADDLQGVLTDRDILFRVVAKCLDPATVRVDRCCPSRMRTRCSWSSQRSRHTPSSPHASCTGTSAMRAAFERRISAIFVPRRTAARAVGETPSATGTTSGITHDSKNRRTVRARQPAEVTAAKIRSVVSTRCSATGRRCWTWPSGC